MDFRLISKASLCWITKNFQILPVEMNYKNNFYQYFYFTMLGTTCTLFYITTPIDNRNEDTVLL